MDDSRERKTISVRKPAALARGACIHRGRAGGFKFERGTDALCWPLRIHLQRGHGAQTGEVGNGKRQITTRSARSRPGRPNSRIHARGSGHIFLIKAANSCCQRMGMLPDAAPLSARERL